MSKKLLKAFSIITILLMLVVMVAGCNGKGSDTDGTTQDSAAETSQASDDDNESEDPPASTERVELKIEVFDRGTQGQTPVDDNYWTNWIQEQFGDPNNIDLTFVPCPRSEEVQQLNMWMAANSAPDICFSYDENVIYNYYKQDGLTDLTDALDEHGADLKEYLGEELLESVQFYGEQYQIPAKRVMVAATNTFIRKDWLDKLDMEIPETTEDFYEVLKAFKEKNPGGVDKVVPFGMTSDVQWCARGFVETFREECSDKEYYIKNRLFLPGYKEAMQYLNKLYNEGLISPEFPIDKDGSILDQDIIRGVCGSYHLNYDMALRDVPGHIKNLKANITEAELIPIDPYTNKYTRKHTKQVYHPAGLRIIVPKSSERANEAIKYLNWMTDKDVIFFLQNGNEGIGHEMVDGIPKVKEVEGEQMFPSMQNIDYTLILNGVDLGDEEKTIKANAMSYPGLEDLYPKCVEFAMRDSYIAPTLPVPVDADAKYGASLKEKEEELCAKVITAKPEDFDALWEELINEYLAAGGQEVIDERTAAWEEMMEN